MSDIADILARAVRSATDSATGDVRAQLQAAVGAWKMVPKQLLDVAARLARLSNSTRGQQDVDFGRALQELQTRVTDVRDTFRQNDGPLDVLTDRVQQGGASLTDVLTDPAAIGTINAVRTVPGTLAAIGRTVDALERTAGVARAVPTVRAGFSVNALGIVLAILAAMFLMTRRRR